MGFTNQERQNIASKILFASVIDGNEGGQWYESFFANRFVAFGNNVWTDPDLATLLGLPAANVGMAQAAAAANPTVIDDRSDFTAAVRLSEVPGSNGSTYVAYESYNDFTSEHLQNWIQPQFITQANGFPSVGYAVRLFDGDPNGGGTEVLTTDGTTGTGENKTVAWFFDYANGMLVLSADFRSTVADPYIVGFRYIGTTAGAADGYSDGYIAQVQETIPVVDLQTIINLSELPSQDNAVQMFVNGVKQQYGNDYTVSSGVVTYTGSPTLLSTDEVEFWYIVFGEGENASTQSWAASLSVGNTSGGTDALLNGGSKLGTPDTNNSNVEDLTLEPGSVLSGNGDGGNVVINPTPGLGAGDDGYVIINGIYWPYQDGSPGQAIVTDGVGNLTFDDVAGSSEEVEIAGDIIAPDDTPVTIITYTPADETVTNIVVKLAAYDGFAVEGAVFTIQGAFITSGGSTTQMGITGLTHYEAQDPSWSADFSISGADIEIQVTGDDTNPTNWRAVARITQV